VRIDPTLRRIRAVIRTAAVNAAYKAGVIGSAVVVPYIRFRYALGEFFKLKFLTDTARVSEGETYFAEDYTDPGYVGVPFALSVGKVLADTALARDVLAFFAPRSFSDSFSVADTAVRRVGKNLSDTATAADAATRSITKGFADTAALADTSVRSVGKLPTDTASLLDVVALAPRLVIIDQPVASDSGSLRMQDYCDFSYFAEDYVGVSRAFT
jgi:hypothetical protein